MNNARVKGFLFVMVACLTYGIMPALTQLAFLAGLSVSTVLFGRLTLGVIFVWIRIFIKKINFKIGKKHIGYLLFIGCALVVQTVTMSESYRLLPGAIVSLLMFLYVSVVVITEICIGREKFDKTRLICVVCSFVGLVLVIWTPGEGIVLSVTGILLALAAAIGYGLYVVGVGEQRTRKLDSEVIVIYATTPPVLFSLGMCISLGEPLLPQTAEQGMYVFLLAFFCLFVAAICFTKGVQYIGASNAAIFNTAEPIVAYVAGIVLMSDEIAGSAIIGGILILGAIIYLNLSSRGKAAS